MQTSRIASLVAAAFIVSAPAVAQRATVAPVWIADSRGGCQIWNETPMKDEQVAWTGPCVNNFPHGRGVMQWYYRGHPTGRYEGDYVAGRMEGAGVFVTRDGQRYEGVWRANTLQGTAVESLATAELPFRHR